VRFVFDFGRVLFRWEPTQLVQRALPRRAANADGAGHWAAEIFQGHDGEWGEYDRGTVQPHELARRIALRTGLAESEVQAVIDAVAEELQPLPASVALLRRLRGAGRATYFLSNMPEPVATQVELRHQFVREFDDGVFSGRVGLAKPDPAIFALAAERFGAPPAELLLLDDHEPNVIAARSLGWNALHFLDAGQAELELRDRGWV
jgi:putative hydrolase of the HAD superfamily